MRHQLSALLRISSLQFTLALKCVVKDKTEAAADDKCIEGKMISREFHYSVLLFIRSRYLNADVHFIFILNREF